MGVIETALADFAARGLAAQRAVDAVIEAQAKPRPVLGWAMPALGSRVSHLVEEIDGENLIRCGGRIATGRTFWAFPPLTELARPCVRCSAYWAAHPELDTREKSE